MSDLLTRDEYKAIAADLSLPVNAWINGKFMRPKSGKTMASLNPATGEVLGAIANDSCYGLQASLYTSNVTTAWT